MNEINDTLNMYVVTNIPVEQTIEFSENAGIKAAKLLFMWYKHWKLF